MTQQINLLQPRAIAGIGLVWTGGAFVLSVLVMIGLGVRASAETAQLRIQVANMDTNLVRARAAMEHAKQRASGPAAQALAGELSELRVRSEAMRLLLEKYNGDAIGSADGYAGYLTALASIAQDNVWVTGVTINRSGKDVAITGQALRNDDVVAYVKRLNQAYKPLGVHFNSIEFRPEAAAAGASAAGARTTPTVSFKVS